MLNAEAPISRESHVAAQIAEFQAGAALRREGEQRCAKALAEISRLGGWELARCASVGEFGERFAVPAAETRVLLGFGQALEAVPEVAERVRTGRISVAAAACVGEVAMSPGLQREGDAWLEWAETESTAQLRRRLQKRREEARLGGGPTVPATVFVPEATREDFHRARRIASRKSQRALSDGAAFTCIIDHYLDTFDPARVTAETRRCPPTCFVRGRYIPAEVRREVHARQSGRCALRLCDNEMFVQHAHIVWHASGGDREADNILLFCSRHHRMFDTGRIRLEGTAAKPRFLDRQGRDLDLRIAHELPTTPARGREAQTRDDGRLAPAVQAARREA